MRTDSAWHDREFLKTLAVVLAAVAFIVWVTFAALVLSTPVEVPEEESPVTVYDEPANTIAYVDEACPVCGEPAIATTEEIICNNGACPMHGRVQENTKEYTYEGR